MQFTTRSSEKEFLDEATISTRDLYQNLSELDTINKFTGGYRASLKGLALLLKHKPGLKSVLDIGYGGGDFIYQLNKYVYKRGSAFNFYGADLKPDCFNYAKQRLGHLKNVELFCSDYKLLKEDIYKNTDIIHCSLFLHHLQEKEIIELFQRARIHNCVLLVNDLHRNKIAYYSIKYLTRLFSKSWLVKNDAPVSVKRGFTRTELEQMLLKAGFTNYYVKWFFAFRYIVIAIS